MLIAFDGTSPAKLQHAGFALNFSRPLEFHPDFAIEKPVVVQGTIMTMGHFRMGAFSASYGESRLNSVDIGRYCSFAPDLQAGWEEHPVDWAMTSMLGYVKDLHGWATLMGRPDHAPAHEFQTINGITKIGNDVWIGQGVFIRSGVTIGDGAIIGSRSVVLKDVEPYSIVVGTPARVIRKRFDDETIESMLKLQWWRYSVFDMPANLLNDPIRFIDHMNEAIEAGTMTEYEPGWTTAEDLATIVSQG
jgi:hypothetical protein